MFAEKTVLRIPGPTPVPPEVARAMGHAMVGHRSSEFSVLLAEVLTDLRELMQTSGSVAILAGTGTTGLETALVNLVEPDDEVLSVSTGNFGDRFADIASRVGATVHSLSYEWGQAAQAEDIERALTEQPHIKVVLVTHCETSTGVLNDVKAIADVVHRHGGYLVVDAVSSFIGAPLPVDEWRVDVMVTGSQKALGLPPGLALVGVSERAAERMREIPRRTLYLDLVRYFKDAQANTTPFTPPVSLVYGLQAALSLLRQEGLPQTQRRHLLLRDMTRAGVRAMGLPLLVAEDIDASPTVTTVGMLDFDADAVRKVMKSEFHIAIAGGQKHLSGKIFRIGHMGYIDAGDVLHYLACLETALAKTGHAVPLGAGVAAAQEVYLRHAHTGH